MQDIAVKISKATRMVYKEVAVIGNDGENLQANLIFSFTDQFVNGVARIDYQFENGEKHFSMLEKQDESYTIPVRSILTKVGTLFIQLIINEAATDEVPIFKSNIFRFRVNQSLNATEVEPSEYHEWIDIANEKLAEMQNLNLDANRVEDGVEITITKKDGSTKSVEVYDGQGTSGFDYDDLDNKPSINGVELSGNKTLNDLGIDQDFIKDNNYVHTDNNFTNAEKTKLSGLENYDDTEVKQDINDLGIEINNLDLNKVPSSRKINNKALTSDINLTPSDIGIGNVFTLKGSVAIIADLPQTGNQIGDVYYVESEEVGYIWLEKSNILQWEQLGLPIDLSNYYNKTETDTLLNDKQDNLVFNTAYNPSTNKVATMSDINSIVGDIANELGDI